jgi:hypothetical protein
MATKIMLYGLLHLAKGQSSAQNVNVSSFSRQRTLYVLNAVTLSRSLAAHDIQFLILTNDCEQIDCELKAQNLSGDLLYEEIPFETDVPPGIRFYSAHFKLDVFRHLAKQSSEHYLGLIDLDMIAMAQLPTCLIELAERGIPVYYDISDQVIPAYGHDRIRFDMARLSTSICEARWSGGELIFGRPDFFESLARETDAIFRIYRDTHAELHHQGDEIITSAALEAMRFRDGLIMAEGGKLGIVGRYWSRPVKHSQPSFDYFSNAFLLHLPADKQWLANTALHIASNPDKLRSEYRRHLDRMLFMNLLRNIKSLLDKRMVRA